MDDVISWFATNLETIFFVFFLLVAVLAVFFYFRRAQKMRKIFSNQVLKRNGLMRGGSSFSTLTFTYLECPVTVTAFLGKSSGGRTGGYSSPYTRVSATINTGDVIRSQGQQMTVYCETWASEIAKKFGSQDIQIGNQEFDQEYMIKGTDEIFIRQILTTTVQEKLLKLRTYHPMISLEMNELVVKVPKILKNEEAIDLLVDSALVLIDRLKAM